MSNIADFYIKYDQKIGVNGAKTIIPKPKIKDN